ncbi:glutamate 5-kinase [Sphaeroforma arctica JP610]|uniref:Glutamate 5-kinase n=1 Tax=Sphaeroforma arctica JP610 TaxID=667725 RepID=A0A0L0FDA0_9EUKA|nr:glutamate 5-kinase [Sphaeroforma arctica JP610]KNC74727.1 glutamate 5-kinase [Sphaeroforma arctica JP610]|eukprot:XP_014148629.1 glutamate 5-kinase [Sphaeroforma arctica JP610]
MNQSGRNSCTGKSGTVVIKIGSSSLANEETGQVKLQVLSALVDVICNLKTRGYNVVLVSSGAVGLGQLTMGMTERPSSTAGKQALAAIGQGKLMSVYDSLFGYFNVKVAQVLLSRPDLSDKYRFNRVKNTMSELFNLGVIPILNENDTLTVEQELVFGDNDSLSAMVSALVEADWLFLMTDVDGLYDTNPHTNPDAQRLKRVSSFSDLEVVTEGSSSKFGTGGMATKLNAARMSTACGCHCVITNASTPEDILTIMDGGDKGTLFEPKDNPVTVQKRFLTYGAMVKGKVFVDAGAERAIAKKCNLFPSGITSVEGDFETESVVSVIGPKGADLGQGIVNYSSEQIEMIKGHQSEDIHDILGFDNEDYVIDRDVLAVNPHCIH